MSCEDTPTDGVLSPFILKKIGTIPRIAYVYDRILEYWSRFHAIKYEVPPRHLDINIRYIHSIEIIEGDSLPVEYWDCANLSRIIYISQGWLKYFITPKELADLTAIRMLGDDK